MLFEAHFIPYQQTNKFSKIVLDYLQQSETIQPFYAQPPTFEGIKTAMEAKTRHAVDRNLLVTELQKQYQSIAVPAAVEKNIQALRTDTTFTVCTAHQPNIFTGPLYFMYKIIHAIKLADQLKQHFPGNHFVPVYYMGSEDADFAELNHTYVNGHRIEWQKKQTGAVGRMVADKQLTQLINELEGQLSIQAHGQEVIDLLKRCYAEGKTIQSATFELVNELYGTFGLVVLIPDNPALKRSMLPVFAEDMFQQTSSSLVAQTSKDLEQHYNVQAHPREINLFYLKDNIRERLIKTDTHFLVHNTPIQFTEEALKNELKEHPERFSPNVILRGLFQETVLPNIAFIGGGGELAYWLQLKKLFQYYQVPFPVLVLRNSFMIIEKQWQALMQKLHVSDEVLFRTELQILNTLIEEQGKRPQLNGQLNGVEEIYTQLNAMAATVDVTLVQHVAALRAKTLRQLQELEKKLFRAERKKHEAVKHQIGRLKKQLFPNNGLQERVENFSSFYARWGKEFLQELYTHSLSLEQQFIILKEM